MPRITSLETVCCRQCGQRFAAPIVHCRVFCSKRCYHASTRKERALRVCEQCGQTFALRRRRRPQRFCSVRCHMIARNRAARMPQAAVDAPA